MPPRSKVPLMVSVPEEPLPSETLVAPAFILRLFATVRAVPSFVPIPAPFHIVTSPPASPKALLLPTWIEPDWMVVPPV